METVFVRINSFIIIIIIKKEMLNGLESLQYLNLQINKISNIDASAFDYIPQCTELWFGGNDLSYIRADTFEKLPHLVKLELSVNRIFYIESGAFTKQRKLKRLYLHRNGLTTLRRSVFSSQHKKNLTLLLSHNPLQCDTTLCWIKQAERDGWITLNYTTADDYLSKPDCANYLDLHWDDIRSAVPWKVTVTCINKILQQFNLHYGRSRWCLAVALYYCRLVSGKV